MAIEDNWIRPHLKQLSAYQSARDLFLSDGAVLLDANENPYGEANRYPDPKQVQLTEKLAEIWKTDANQVLATHGSDEGLDLLFRLLVVPGVDRVLICPPTYGMYGVIAAIHGVSVVEVQLRPNFTIDFEGLQNTVEQVTPKMILITNPNNPTGNLVGDIERVLQLSPNLVVVDEAYMDFCPEFSAVPLLKKYPNLIITKTLSKAYGMAGLRIGAILASPFLISWLRKIKLPYNISTLTQKHALCQLEKIENLAALRDEIIDEREKLQIALKRLSIVINVYPSQANFLLVSVTEPRTVFQALLAAGIIVRDRSKEVANALRITVGTPEENRLLIKELKHIANALTNNKSL
ncbi:MAG: histidinol-phosphate transaminase [Schleiferiaceae bacterium]|nr:histidinol-phosphate transaminase [Schleiferiaceae bacterium]